MSDLLGTTYDAVTAHVSGLPPERLEEPSRAAAGNVRQLLFHLLLDAQRALVTFATPADGEPDVDEVTYWRPFLPGARTTPRRTHASWSPPRTRTTARPACCGSGR